MRLRMFFSNHRKLKFTKKRFLNRYEMWQQKGRIVSCDLHILIQNPYKRVMDDAGCLNKPAEIRFFRRYV